MMGTQQYVTIFAEPSVKQETWKGNKTIGHSEKHEGEETNIQLCLLQI